MSVYMKLTVAYTCRYILLRRWVYSDQADISGSSGLHSIQDTDITKSSITVKWELPRNTISEDLHQYYGYRIEYKQSGSPTWTSGDIIPYDPDDESPQTTIINLTPNTEYDIRVLAIRTVNGETDETENPNHTNTRTVKTLKVKGNVRITIIIVFILANR